MPKHSIKFKSPYTEEKRLNMLSLVFSSPSEPGVIVGKIIADVRFNAGVSENEKRATEDILLLYDALYTNWVELVENPDNETVRQEGREILKLLNSIKVKGRPKKRPINNMSYLFSRGKRK